MKFLAGVLLLAVWLTACSSSTSSQTSAKSASTSSTGPLTGDAAAVEQIVLDQMKKNSLQAVIVRVTVDGKDVLTKAYGDSMTGVPATTQMHFRNGAVAISYMSTLLLRLVDEKKVGLDDKVSKWLPDLPSADQVTLKQLANMTSGYFDYEKDPGLQAAIEGDPFRNTTTEEQLRLGTSKPLLFPPGTNWSYAHTNYVVLGQALEKATGQKTADLLDEKVLKPMGLKNTTASQTAAMPEPVLHAYSPERRQVLGIPPTTSFIEESTFWNPSWSLNDGAVETTDIVDMATTADAIGSGKVLSPESHHAQVDPNLLGFGAPLAGCPLCHTLDEKYNYGLGVVRSGNWLLQNPLFFGYGSVEASLPSKKIAIAVATTLGVGSVGADGNIPNFATPIFTQIAAHMSPDDVPKIGT